MENNKDTKTSSVTVKNINKDFFERNPKLHLYLTRAVALTAAAVLVLSFYVLGKVPKKEISPVPENQVSITIEVDVQPRDTIYDIASKYYTDECEGVYNAFNNFEDAIREQNDIKGDVLMAYSTINIPVIVDKDNPYYLNLLEIESKIADIKENNLWVSYILQPTDDISSLAALASGDFRDTPKIVAQILRKNNIDNPSLIQPGKPIFIMNPELGPLMEEYYAAQKQLSENVINPNKQKK